MRKLLVKLALVFSALGFSSSAMADETHWSDWTKMNPDSFLIDIDDMDDRCLVGAAVTSVTTAECEEAKTMLQAGACDYTAIPDGVRYEFLMGLSGGQERVYHNMVKRLGVTRMAFSCQVSTGRVIDWYAGEDGVSCGNVAARPLDQPTPVASRLFIAPMPVIEEQPQRCRWEPVPAEWERPTIIMTPAMFLAWCRQQIFISGITIDMGGSTNTQNVKVCG